VLEFDIVVISAAKHISYILGICFCVMLLYTITGPDWNERRSIIGRFQAFVVV
jgi:hypothetical protein